MLKQRILTALVLLALFIPAVLWLPPIGWAALISVIVGLAAWEWAGLAGYGKGTRIGYGVFVAMLLFGLSMGLTMIEEVHFFYLLLFSGLCFLFWFVVVPLWLYFRWSLKGIPGLGVGLIVLLPAGLIAAAAGLMPKSPFGIKGKMALLGILMIVWIADTCAYFVGRKFGKHKLAPNISPGKTWEGVAGAVVGVFLYTMTLLLLTVPHSNSFIIHDVAFFFVLALVLTAASVIGDLFESLLKRQAGIKDSSHLLPGHGGILDRIDSLLALLPVFNVLMFFLFVYAMMDSIRNS